MKTTPTTKPKQPTIVVIAGPNGAGTSTAAPYLLKQALVFWSLSMRTR